MFTAAAIAISGAVCFALGVIFGKKVLGDAEAIKQHVSAEVAALHDEIRKDLQGAAQKI